MSATATFWAWKCNVRSVHHLIVLLCLADRHNAETGQCNPSVKLISKTTKCDRKTVMKCIAELQRLKLISVLKKHGSGNHYQLNISPNHGASTIIWTSASEGTSTGTSRGTTPVPLKGHEPKRNLKENPKYKGIYFGSLPQTITQNAAMEFIDHRINLKKRLTQNAFNRAMMEADKPNTLGLTPVDILLKTIDFGWLSINFIWLESKLQTLSQPTDTNELMEKSWD